MISDMNILEVHYSNFSYFAPIFTMIGGTEKGNQKKLYEKKVFLVSTLL